MSLVKIDSYTPFPVSGPDFSDDFSSDNMTDVGSGVGVSGGKLQMINAQGGNNRSWQSLGLTLDDTAWVARYDYLLGSGTTVDGQPTYAITMTAGSGDPIRGDACMTQVNNTSTFNVTSYDGGSAGSLSSPSVPFSTDTKYYLDLIRSSSTVLDIDWYTDSGYSTHISGSPESVAIASTVVSLDTFQMSMKSNQAGGSNDAEIEEIAVYDGVTSVP